MYGVALDVVEAVDVKRVVWLFIINSILINELN